MSLSSQCSIYKGFHLWATNIWDPRDQLERLAFLTSWHIGTLELSEMSFDIDVAPCTFLHFCLFCCQPSSLPISLLLPTNPHMWEHTHTHTRRYGGGVLHLSLSLLRSTILIFSTPFREKIHAPARSSAHFFRLICSSEARTLCYILSFDSPV